MARGIRMQSAALALLLASCSQLGGAPFQTPAVQREARYARSFSHVLFVASAEPYFVAEYALPLSSASMPIVTVSGIDEPVPLAVDSDHLIAGSFDDGAVYRYRLPLGVSSGRFVKILDAGTPSGLAIGAGYLYVAASAPNLRETISAYARPVQRGSIPVATIQYGTNDFLGIAATRDTLYAASAATGTLRAYATPLAPGERARFTIHLRRQQNAAIGVAATEKQLYVTDYTTGALLQYALPYQPGEKPVRVDMKRANGGVNPQPYGVAADAAFVYVSAFGAIYQYRTPLRGSELPDAIVPFDGFAAGVAVFTTTSSQPQ